jgi:hypothetical protein
MHRLPFSTMTLLRRLTRRANACRQSVDCGELQLSRSHAAGERDDAPV